MANHHLLSVCLPTYDMHGVGHIFLRHSFEILAKQAFKDFDVVISDYSTTPLVKNLCDEYRNRLDIKYYINTDPDIGQSANINNAIKHATGKLIKILWQDDFLYDERSLAVIIENFDLSTDHWLVTACEHSTDGVTFFRPFYPSYNDKVYQGNNTISSPSVLTIKNDYPFLFDKKLKWLVDCDFYKRLYDHFGPPKIVNTIAVVNRVGEHQITSTEATAKVRSDELKYVKRKFHKRARNKLHLPNVTLVAVTGLGTAGAVRALKLSMDRIDYYDSVLIAHQQPEHLDERITFKQCRPDQLTNQDPKNTNDYSRFMAYDLWEYIDSKFALIVHNDAYVLRPDKWDCHFLDYDYIGAPWPADLHYANYGVNVRVGNGGFSLRSNKCLRALHELGLPFTDKGTGYFHEDGIICNYYRKELEAYGLKFAPVHVASRFSHEIDCPDSDPEPFGFHNNRSVIPRFFFFKHWLRKHLPL